MQPIITLTSDWRLRDPYIAIFKGLLQNHLPQANIIDITHHLDFNNLNQTAFLLLQSYPHFPQGSIHLILTNVSASSQFNPVVFEYDGHYFIGEDNGIFCLMFGQKTALKGRIFQNDNNLNALEKILSSTQDVAAGDYFTHTEEYTDFSSKFMPEAINFINDHKIEGEIVYIDAYCNALTNIPTEMFLEATKGENFQGIIMSKTDWPINEYHEQYVESNKFYFTNNMLNCLEITYYQGKIAILADLKVGDKVEISY